MEEVKKEVLGKAVKKNIIWMIIGVVLIVLSLGLLSWAYVLIREPLDNPEDLSMLANQGEEIEGKYVKLNVQTISDSFAVYAYEGAEEASQDKLYFVTDGSYIFVVEMKNDLFNQLKELYDYTYRESDDVQKPDSITITGMTVKIDDDIKGLIINGYNDIMQEDFLTNENFNDYIGTIYLNTLAKPIQYAQWQIFGGILGLIIGITIACIYASRVVTSRTTLKLYEKSEELDSVYRELENDNTKDYSHIKLFLTEHYIIDYAKGIQIVKYRDIIWMYPYELRRNGITTLKQIVLFLENSNQKYRVANFSGNRDEKIFNDIYDFICDKVPKSLKGYSQENKKEILVKRRNKE